MPTTTYEFDVPQLFAADFSASDNIPYPPWPWPESTQVGANPWGDNSDATYTQNTRKARSEEIPGGFRNTTWSDWSWAMLPDQALAGVDPATITAARLVWRLSNPGWKTRRFNPFFVWNYALPNDPHPGNYIGNGENFALGPSITSSATISGSTILSTQQLTQIALPGHPYGISPFITAAFLDQTQTNGDILQGRVHRLALEVDTLDAPRGVRLYPIHPPERLYPRSDGRGTSSAPRLYGGAKGRSRV